MTRVKLAIIALAATSLAGCGPTDTAPRPDSVPSAASTPAASATLERVSPAQADDPNKPEDPACQLLSGKMFEELAGGPIQSYETTGNAGFNLTQCNAFSRPRTNYTELELSCREQAAIKYTGFTSPNAHPTAEPFPDSAPNAWFSTREGGTAFVRTPDGCLIRISLSAYSTNTVEPGVLAGALKQAYEAEVALGKPPV